MQLTGHRGRVALQCVVRRPALPAGDRDRRSYSQVVLSTARYQLGTDPVSAPHSGWGLTTCGTPAAAYALTGADGQHALWGANTGIMRNHRRPPERLSGGRARAAPVPQQNLLREVTAPLSRHVGSCALSVAAFSRSGVGILMHDRGYAHLHRGGSESLVALGPDERGGGAYLAACSS
jgi:hypothetical protein